MPSPSEQLPLGQGRAIGQLQLHAVRIQGPIGFEASEIGGIGRIFILAGKKHFRFRECEFMAAAEARSPIGQFEIARYPAQRKLGVKENGRFRVRHIQRVAISHPVVWRIFPNRIPALGEANQSGGPDRAAKDSLVEIGDPNAAERVDIGAVDAVAEMDA